MVRLATRLLRRKIPEYWTRYTDRAINLRSKPARYVPLRGWVGEDKRLNWTHTEYHPGTAENQAVNSEHKKPTPELIEPIKEWTIFLGDRVEVLVGRDKGKHGLVNNITHERNWVFVEGLNLQFQLDKKLRRLLPVEMPLDVSTEVALVDPTTGKAAESAEWRYTEVGQRVRVLLPSEAILNPQDSAQKLPDGVLPDAYIANAKTDTSPKQLNKTTYVYDLKTFEEDTMDRLGIKEERKRGKTYWY